ncbi:MAG: hypothetical protein EA394_11640 [Bacteroidia bacterium]|nr:MAG: hypothetical protein EA394_11640 [Bacteroidia bacterium]
MKENIFTTGEILSVYAGELSGPVSDGRFVGNTGCLVEFVNGGPEGCFPGKLIVTAFGSAGSIHFSDQDKRSAIGGVCFMCLSGVASCPRQSLQLPVADFRHLPVGAENAVFMPFRVNCGILIGGLLEVIDCRLPIFTVTFQPSHQESRFGVGLNFIKLLCGIKKQVFAGASRIVKHFGDAVQQFNVIGVFFESGSKNLDQPFTGGIWFKHRANVVFGRYEEAFIFRIELQVIINDVGSSVKGFDDGVLLQQAGFSEPDHRLKVNDQNRGFC